MKVTAKFVGELKLLCATDLIWNKETKSHDESVVYPTVIQRDGRTLISAEDGGHFADYYGEFRGGYPWIHPALNELAKRHGFYFEWENPGAIMLVEA